MLSILSFVAQIKAQMKIAGDVIDSKTKEAIPYVNIGIVKLSKGTVSDFEGKYELQVDSFDDEVTFSSIGYETLNIKAGLLKNNITITMTSIGYEIEMIEVVATKFEDEDIMLGVKNKKRGHSVGFGNAQLGTEIGAIIEIKKPTYIKSANFVFNHARGDSLLLRINIYEMSEGQIGKNMLTENIFIKEKQRKGAIEVNMEKYNIILKSDVLLTLEWIKNYDENGNKQITFDTKKSKNNRGVYVRYSSNGEFAKLPYKSELKPCFYFIGKQSR